MRAYRRALASKQIEPEPGKNHVLEVTWGVERDEPMVKGLRFLPGGQEAGAVVLKLPGEN